MGDEALEARLERAHTVIGDLLRSLGEVELLPERQQAAAREAMAFLEETGVPDVANVRLVEHLVELGIFDESEIAVLKRRIIYGGPRLRAAGDQGAEPYRQAVHAAQYGGATTAELMELRGKRIDDLEAEVHRLTSDLVQSDERRKRAEHAALTAQTDLVSVDRSLQLSTPLGAMSRADRIRLDLEYAVTMRGEIQDATVKLCTALGLTDKVSLAYAVESAVARMEQPATDLARRIRECDYICEYASWQGDGDWLRDATDGELLDQILARLAEADRLEDELGTVNGMINTEKVGGAVVMVDGGTLKERVTAAVERARMEGRRESEVERASLVAKLQLVREAVGAELRADGDDVVERARALQAEVGDLREFRDTWDEGRRERLELIAIRATLPAGDEQVPVSLRVAQLVREHGEMVAEMMKAADPEDIADAAASLAEPRSAPAQEPEAVEFIDVLFDGEPGPTAGRFVEVEDHRGHSIKVGEWLRRGDGMWALRIPMQPPAEVGEVMAAAGALSALTAVVATSGMNWQRSPCLAWVYGVLVGHDRDVLEDLQLVFNWPDGTVDEIDRHRRALLAARGA